MTLGTMKPRQSSKLASFRGDTFRGDTHFQVVSPLLNYRYTNYNQHLHCNVEVTFTIFTSPKKKTTVFFSRYVCQGIFVKPQQRSNQPSQLKPHQVEVSVWTELRWRWYTSNDSPLEGHHRRHVLNVSDAFATNRSPLVGSRILIHCT